MEIKEALEELLTLAKQHQWIYDEIGWEQMNKAINKAEKVLKNYEMQKTS